MSDALRLLKLTPAAERDLEDIWVYTAETWGAAQAERYLDDIGAVFERLTAFPEMARLRPEFTPPVRIHPTGRHLVIYVVTEDSIEVLRVLGARQDWVGMLAALD